MEGMNRSTAAGALWGPVRIRGRSYAPGIHKTHETKARPSTKIVKSGKQYEAVWG